MKKKLYYGAYEYIETKEELDREGQRFIYAHQDGYFMTRMPDGTPAIYYEGVLYKQGKKYREYESVGRRIHENQKVTKGR